MLEIFLWIVGIYLALGILMTIALSQTPYRENSWIFTVLLWPLFFIAMVG